MPRSSRKGLVLCLAFFCFALATVLPGPLSPSASADSEKEIKPMVVCSTTQVADFARQIGGDDVDVRCILAPGADPHTYMPTPDDSRLVVNSQLCLQNGLHLEGSNWMGNLARDAGKPIVTCAAGVAPLEMDYEGHIVEDPHAWFSPKNAAVYVNNITRAFAELQPEKKWKFQARAKLYLQQLRVLDSWIRAEVGAIPAEQRVLVTSHDAFNYFCKEYAFNPDNDYKSLAPVGWSTGSEVGAGMTPQRQKQVVQSIRDAGARAVFVETSVNPKLIRQIAQQAGVRIGGELYSDSMGQTGSAGETYIGMMRENVLTIVGALVEEK